VDFNGNYTNSDIRAVYPQVNVIEIISIYPNPAEEEIYFEVISAVNTKVAIYVIDNTGKKVIHKKANISEGSNILKLNIGFLNSACYTLYIITETGLYKTQKEFIK
jgi:tRNA U54 and U55 pseudouridine synthase Pus10